MKLLVAIVILLTSLVVVCDSFLFPDFSARSTKTINRLLQNNIRKYHHRAKNEQIAAGQRAENETATSAGETQEDESEQEKEQEEEDDSGSGIESRNQLETASRKPEASDRRLRRTFNSALGIGIDSPGARPPSNAYDIHHSNQGGPSWQSPNSENDAYAVYYYYYYDEDEYGQDTSKKSRRQLVEPAVRSILSEDKHSEMEYRFGNPRTLGKWMKLQN